MSGSLIDACLEGDLEAVKSLLKKPRIVNSIATYENCALRCAASKGHLEIVKLLLTYPKVVEAIGAEDNMALHWGIMYGYFEIVKALIDAYRSKL